MPPLPTGICFPSAVYRMFAAATAHSESDGAGTVEQRGREGVGADNDTDPGPAVGERDDDDGAVEQTGDDDIDAVEVRGATSADWWGAAAGAEGRLDVAGVGCNGAPRGPLKGNFLSDFNSCTGKQRGTIQIKMTFQNKTNKTPPCHRNCWITMVSAAPASNPMGLLLLGSTT
jgi:hypothetical protein